MTNSLQIHEENNNFVVYLCSNKQRIIINKYTTQDEAKKFMLNATLAFNIAVFLN